MEQEKIGKFILQLRKEKEMTQKELAEKLGVTDRAVSKWENGRGMPDVSLMKQLCDLLGITVSELLSGERIDKQDYREKSEFRFLNTIEVKEKAIKKKNVFLRVVAAVTAVLLLSVFLLMDARVITRRYFYPGEELEIFDVRKRLPVAPEGEIVSRDEPNEFVDQVITWRIDIEELKEVLPLMRVSIFPIYMNSYWMGDNTYEITGYIKSGPRKGQHFSINLGDADVNYLRTGKNYKILNSDAWMQIVEMLEGWEADYRENFQWEGDNDIAIFYQGVLHKGSYITLLSRSGDWWKVEYAKGKAGYCHSDYISAVYGVPAAIKIQSGTLNVRSGPGTSYPVAGSLAKGETVIAFSTVGGWSHILYGGTKTGYVSAQYLWGSTSNTTSYPSISLSVPSFKQTDSRWANVLIGQSGKTMAKIGCATTGIAMMESYRTGKTIYPDAMAKQLRYTASGSVYWPSHFTAVTGSSGYLQGVYNLLKQGKPVLLGAKNTYGSQHWVVVTGYTGGSTLTASGFSILDPGSNSRVNLQQFLSAYPTFYKYFHY